MARKFLNSRRFLIYRHLLRSYTSILYLRLPPSFWIILRGKDVEHHDIVNDMMLSQEITFRPHFVNNTAVVTFGFVKDAKSHIDVQGFNVYHKNRLIKLFWRVCNGAGSDGHGVIGVLEANFIKPAQDKKWFEQTSALAKLKACLLQMQKNYWSTNCHKIGYASRSNKKVINASADKDGLHRICPSSYLDDTESQQASGGSFARPFIQPQAKVAEASYRDAGFDLITVNKLKQENHILKERLQKKEEELIGEKTGVDRLKLSCCKRHNIR